MKNIILPIFILNSLVINLFSPYFNTKEREYKKTTKTFIEQLKDKESMLIFFGKSGCFSSKADSGYVKFKIARDDENYFAFYNGKEKKISNEDVNFIKKMETDLDSISTIIKCSNNDHYIFKYNKKIKNKIDNTCKWKGFERLVGRLFDE